MQQPASAHALARGSPSAGVAVGVNPTYVKLGHTALRCKSPARPPKLPSYTCRSPHVPKMLHLQQDFLGGVSRAAGRQESSYNTRVEEMVPGKRSSRVTLKYQEGEGFEGPVPFLQWLRARGARGSWPPGKITQPVVQMEPCTWNRVISAAGL